MCILPSFIYQVSWMCVLVIMLRQFLRIIIIQQKKKKVHFSKFVRIQWTAPYSPSRLAKSTFSSALPTSSLYLAFSVVGRPLNSEDVHIVNLFKPA